MDFPKALPFLVIVLCITALGLFGNGRLASMALSLLALFVLHSRR